MRKRTWLLGFAALAIYFLLVLVWKSTKEQPALVETQVPATNQPVLVKHSNAVGNWQIAKDTQQPIRDSSTNHWSNIQSNLMEHALDDWRTPIAFYGRVVDESTNRVAGARIDFDCNDTSPTGTSFYHAESDANGLFSIKDIRGKLLNVKVSKEGYYSYLPFGAHFFYAGENENFAPDENSPVVFKLRKKGQGADLITSENGVRLNVAVRIPKDNSPVRVDLLQKQASATGQLEISQNKPPWRDATNWSFSMNIPSGGFVENQDEFQLQSPEANYEPMVEYHFVKSEANWTSHVTKQFYITFGQPRKYGWLRIESDLTQETVFLTYAINPTGSRNLEPTP